MEEPTLSTESKPRSLAEIDFPSGPGPVPHAVRFIDPRDVESHFAALEVKPRSAEQRWAEKRDAIPFPGV
jgi:hypothetical protein